MAVQLQYNVTAYLGNKYLVDKMFQNEPEIAIIIKAHFIFFRGLVIISHKEIGLKFFPQFQLDFHMKTDPGPSWVSNIS